jgi:hypothetical protein
MFHPFISLSVLSLPTQCIIYHHFNQQVRILFNKFKINDFGLEYFLLAQHFEKAEPVNSLVFQHHVADGTWFINTTMD